MEYACESHTSGRIEPGFLLIVYSDVGGTSCGVVYVVSEYRYSGEAFWCEPKANTRIYFCAHSIETKLQRSLAPAPVDFVGSSHGHV